MQKYTHHGATRRILLVEDDFDLCEALGDTLGRPVPLAEVEGALDEGALARMEWLGLARQTAGGLILTTRGRFLGGGVTAELMAESPAKSTI